MNKSHNHKVGLARGAQLLLLLSLGCSGDADPDQPLREGEVVSEVEASLEDALRTLDRDDIVISYDERSSSMEVWVELDQFAELARGFTVEMNVDVKLPDGTVTRHELDWTSGDDVEVPRIELPAVETGRYEMTLTSLAIDGRTVLDAPAPLQSVELLTEGSPAAPELEVREPSDGPQALQLPGQCKLGFSAYGSDESEALYGSKRNNSMYAYGGDDTLLARGCHDSLWAGAGNDVLDGGSGHDKCYGGPGYDQYISCEAIVPD